jgi:hypothetical protein
MTPALTYQPQTNSGKVTVTVNHYLLLSIMDYQTVNGWNNTECYERQIKRTELTCKTVKPK